MLKYKGFRIPETVQEIMLSSHYGYNSPHLQLASEEGNVKVNAGITFEDLLKPTFSLSETIETCKEVIDVYIEAVKSRKSDDKE